jgi:flavodoxin
MTKTLVVFHSRSGYTRRVAKLVARKLAADVEEIRVVQPLGGPLGYAFCALEAIVGLTPALRPSRHDPADYDMVIVGTPVWFWSLSSPVRSWLSKHRVARAHVAFICTMGGAGADGVFATMTELAHATPVATLALTDAEIESADETKLDAFVASVKGPARRRSPRTRRPVRLAHARA